MKKLLASLLALTISLGMTACGQGNQPDSSAAGADESWDKVEKAGFHTTKAEFVDAPLIDELPMALECTLISYDEHSCRLVGEIVNVSADERILGENGAIDPAKLEPITFDPVNGVYLKLGEQVGHAFRDGAKLK